MDSAISADFEKLDILGVVYRAFFESISHEMMKKNTSRKKITVRNYRYYSCRGAGGEAGKNLIHYFFNSRIFSWNSSVPISPLAYLVSRSRMTSTASHLSALLLCLI